MPVYNVNRFDPNQPPSFSASGLRPNMFATQTVIIMKQTNLQGFEQQTAFISIFRKLPLINKVKLSVKLFSLIS